MFVLREEVPTSYIMQIGVLEDFVAHVTEQIAQCNFDKAKDLCVS